MGNVVKVFFGGKEEPSRNSFEVERRHALEKENLSTDLAKMRQKADGYKRSLENTQQELRSVTSTSNRYYRDLTRSQSRCQELKDMYESLRENVVKLEKMIEHEKQQVTQYKKESIDHKTELKNLRPKGDYGMKLYWPKRGETVQYLDILSYADPRGWVEELQITTWNWQMTQYTKENKDLKTQLEILRPKVAEYMKENEDLKKQLEHFRPKEIMIKDYLEDPWQERDCSEWTQELFDSLKKEIEGFGFNKEEKLQQENISFINILMLGPVGSGKSSFFNTVDSSFKRRLSFRARAGSVQKSLTKAYDMYEVRTPEGSENLRFRLCDCPGLDVTCGRGLSIRDVEAVLEGHVMEGYIFDFNNPITKENPQYRQNPTSGDRIHCVVFVVDGSRYPGEMLAEKVLGQIQGLQNIMNVRKIPQLILLTKVDVLCSAFKKNVQAIFYSKYVYAIVKKVAATLGLPLYCVLPMSNISHSHCMSLGDSILTLYNLRQMLRAAEDFLFD